MKILLTMNEQFLGKQSICLMNKINVELVLL